MKAVEDTTKRTNQIEVREDGRIFIKGVDGTGTDYTQEWDLRNLPADNEYVDLSDDTAFDGEPVLEAERTPTEIYRIFVNFYHSGEQTLSYADGLASSYTAAVTDDLLETISGVTATERVLRNSVVGSSSTVPGVVGIYYHEGHGWRVRKENGSIENATFEQLFGSGSEWLGAVNDGRDLLVAGNYFESNPYNADTTYIFEEVQDGEIVKLTNSSITESGVDLSNITTEQLIETFPAYPLWETTDAEGPLTATATKSME